MVWSLHTCSSARGSRRYLVSHFQNLVCSRQITIRLQLFFPAFHDFPVDGPEADSLTGNMPPPLLADFGADIGQAQGHIAGKVLERLEVDFLIQACDPAIAPPVAASGTPSVMIMTLIGASTRLRSLVMRATSAKERVEIGHTVGGRKPLAGARPRSAECLCFRSRGWDESSWAHGDPCRRRWQRTWPAAYPVRRDACRCP